MNRVCLHDVAHVKTARASSREARISALEALMTNAKGKYL